MKVMEAIGKGFSLAAKNMGLLVLLFVFNIIWNLASIPFLGTTQNLANVRFNPQILILSIIFIFLNIFIQGGALGVLKDAVISGEKALLGKFAGYGKKFYLRFLGLGLVVILILILSALIIGLILSASFVIKNIVVNIISVSIAIIFGAVLLYYLFLLFLSPYTLVVDDVGVFKSMTSSMKFVKGHLMKVVGLSTLLVLIGLGIGFLVGILAGVFSLALKGTAFQVLTGIISSAVNAYLTVIISAALLAYYAALSGAEQKKGQEAIAA